jgi:phenylalanyl-tRNA synthetase beta chain
MIVSLKWLRDYVDISLSIDELVNRLTMAGLEVDEVRSLYPCLTGVITVRLDRIEPHPRADRLRICTVTDGPGTFRVVCGAPNLEEGNILALALPGAELEGGLRLEETKIRGEISQGMLCSEKELGISDDASGLMVLPPTVPLGVGLREALGLDDVILDISVTPNRSDCLSIVGIAREIAAICEAPLRYPSFAVQESGPPVDGLTSVTLDDPVGCPRYAARMIQGVKVGPSPEWLRERLEAIGLRSINNIVDVTNFILMDMGQPLHAFDFDRLREHRIVVRRAKSGERFTTLDGVERVLFDDTLLICDGTGPVAVAGVMGGLDSEINPDTTRVLIESAYFQPQCIRKTGKKLGLRSEASFRFERGVDPVGLIRALDRATQLMLEVGGGEIATGRVDNYPKPFDFPKLSLRVARTNKFLGTRLSASDMAEALRRIEIPVEVEDDDLLTAVPPPFRPDITREVDLAEEVARLVGYDLIPVTSPNASVVSASLDPHVRMRQEVKSYLQGSGFFEVLTYSFISREMLGSLRLPAGDPRLKPVELRNPLSEEQSVMRTTLVPGLLQTARYNLDRRNEDLRIFELGKVFLPREGEPLPSEPHRIAGIMAGRRSSSLLYGGDEIDYTDIKGAAEGVIQLFRLENPRFLAESIPPYLDPACAASIYFGFELLGAVGRIHPEVEKALDLKKSVYVFELDFDIAYGVRGPLPSFRSLPKFPSVTRDMALVVDEGVATREPLDFVLEQKEPLLEKVEVFDIYRSAQLGVKKKSLGYRLIYRASDRSLTDDEINVVHNRLVEKVLVAFHAVLR